MYAITAARNTGNESWPTLRTFTEATEPVEMAPYITVTEENLEEPQDEPTPGPAPEKAGEEEKSMKTIEAIDKAAGSASFLLTELQEAHCDCTAMESIILLGLIKNAAEIRQKVDDFYHAMRSERGKV